MAGFDVRAAVEADLSALADLWHAGWHDAHAEILPSDLGAIRTRAHLADRLVAARASLRVAGPEGAPLGFHICHGDELDQFYVAAQARGTGLAAALLRDAEACIAATGARQAWLACAIGNHRASRFYAREGWERAETREVELAGAEAGEPYALTVWIHRKMLG
ncbi:MAG: GNAT family N-acetyltransferase [Vannielia sp.]|uniref:GNAT family N-acetyltransferase n=1 Tax=Vannielia sp. TaxID=2813045 RepID=UPI003B8D006F